MRGRGRAMTAPIWARTVPERVGAFYWVTSHQCSRLAIVPSSVLGLYLKTASRPEEPTTGCVEERVRRGRRQYIFK